MLRLLATNALTAVSKAQHDSVAKMFAADLKQHDPRLANGLAGVLSLCDAARRESYTRVLHRTLVDGQHVLLHSSTQPLDRSNNAAKVAFELFRLFKELVTVELRYDLIEKFIDDANYAQHASKVGDGIARLRKRIAEVAQQASDESTPVMKLRRYLAEGNFVFCLVEARSGTLHNANWDLFRLENLKLVEHWDIISAIPPREAWKNNTGPF